MKHTKKYSFLIIALYTSVVAGCGDDEIVSHPDQQPPIIFPCVDVIPDSVSASLRGHIDPRGNPTTYACEYGDNLDIEQLSAEGSIDGVFGPIEITVDLSLLSSESRYYFRLKASNIAGTTLGEVDSFMTLSSNVPPETWLSAAPPVMRLHQD